MYSPSFSENMDSSPKSIPEGVFEFHNQENPRYYSLNSNTTLKQNLIVGTSQGRASCLSQSCNSLESNGSVYEAKSIGETSFGGSFGYDEPDGGIFGGNFRSVVADDAQVVPDFHDILETIHIDMDKSDIHSASFLTKSEASTHTRGLQSENCNNYVQKRRNSERDELEIYFPCVLTPIPVDRLYSTLADDSTVFKFPVSSDEFLRDDKAAHGLLNQLNGSSNSIPAVGGGQSLESFGNFSVSANMFEFPTETRKPQDISDSCILTLEKDHCTSRGDCSGDRGSSGAIEKNTLSPSVTAVGNNHNLQKSSTNAYCPEAMNTGDRNYFSKVSLPHPSCQTSFGGLPFQFNSTQLVKHVVKFPPTLAEVTDVSVSGVSLEEPVTNSLFFHSPTKELAGHKVETEGSEGSFERGLAEVLNSSNRTHSETDSPLCGAQDSIWNRTSTKARELQLYSNKSKSKCKATACPDTASSALSTRTSNTLKNSRKVKRVENEDHLGADTRDFHNDMEKQRRTNMKARFQNLRLTIPELLENEKASKIVILQKACQYIRLLEQESIELENRKRSERLRNIELLEKLQKITSGKC